MPRGETSEDRKRQTFNLLARGYSEKVVAKLVGISVETVQRYVRTRRDEIQGTVEQIKRDDYATLVMSRFEMIRSEVLANLRKAKTDNAKSKYLKLLLETNAKELKALHQLGLLENADSQTQVQHEHTVMGSVQVEQVDHNQLDALAAMILAKKMGVTPEHAVSMCGRNVVDAVPALTAGVIHEKSNGGTHEISPVVEPVDAVLVGSSK